MSDSSRTFDRPVWKPDASELAFVSDHEFQFSLFNSANIFSIKPNGSDLHKIPNIHSLSELKNHPKVTVTGRIFADTMDTVPESYFIQLGIFGT